MYQADFKKINTVVLSFFASVSLDVVGNSLTRPNMSNLDDFDPGATPTTEASANGGLTSNRIQSNLAGCHSTTSLKNIKKQIKKVLI